MDSKALDINSLSRIDKLFLDKNALELKSSHQRRAQRGLHINVGNDVKSSYGLQLALLTAVNLGVKCFAGEVIAQTSSDVLLAPCLVPVVQSETLGDAIKELGAKTSTQNEIRSNNRYLILGNATDDDNAVRITYDGWCIAVGPSRQVYRLPERSYCPLASIAAAAIAIGEIFTEFANISVTATRRVISFSLWRPDLPPDHPDAIGEPLVELPCDVGIFGLGHLGQAYLWGLVSLPYPSPKDTTFLLCDDDFVENPNVETGAILSVNSIGRLKTRVVAEWIERRGFTTRLLERRIDENFKRTAKEPLIALSGFDENKPRQWLSEAGYTAIFDSGLGGESCNFDTISFHSWPNPREASMIWPQESNEELTKREARYRAQVNNNPAYQLLGADECGRLMLAGKSVAVPFVGAMAACIVLAEMLKQINGGPIFSDLKVRLCSLDTRRVDAILKIEASLPLRGLITQRVKGGI